MSGRLVRKRGVTQAMRGTSGDVSVPVHSGKQFATANRTLARTVVLVLVSCVFVLTVTVLSEGRTGTEPSLWDLCETLRDKRFVDLTHRFEPGIPHWKGFPDEYRETIYWYEAGQGALGSGFFAQIYTHVGQWGTHVDPPAHFHRGKRTVDQIGLKEMVLPLVVIDASEESARDPDYTLGMAKIEEWEAGHGSIPEGSFVAMRTDWSKRWPDGEKMANRDADGIAHYPGWSRETLAYLIETRCVTAIGHETTDTDPGIATSRDDYSLESYVLGQDCYQIELLANLDRVPEAGAIVIAAFPKPKGGSGFPARVFAICP